jgi:hypothetical protein
MNLCSLASLRSSPASAFVKRRPLLARYNACLSRAPFLRLCIFACGARDRRPLPASPADQNTQPRHCRQRPTNLSAAALPHTCRLYAFVRTVYRLRLRLHPPRATSAATTTATISSRPLLLLLLRLLLLLFLLLLLLLSVVSLSVGFFPFTRFRPRVRQQRLLLLIHFFVQRIPGRYVSLLLLRARMLLVGSLAVSTSFAPLLRLRAVCCLIARSSSAPCAASAAPRFVGLAPHPLRFTVWHIRGIALASSSHRPACFLGKTSARL